MEARLRIVPLIGILLLNASSKELFDSDVDDTRYCSSKNSFLGRLRTSFYWSSFNLSCAQCRCLNSIFLGPLKDFTHMLPSDVVGVFRSWARSDRSDMIPDFWNDQSRIVILEHHHPPLSDFGDSPFSRTATTFGFLGVLPRKVESEECAVWGRIP